MIVNLIGPPGVGKSTFGSRFVLEHPYYSYCSIDNYRISTWNEESSVEQNDQKAWQMFYYGIYYAKDCLIESVGLDHRLEKIFNKLYQRPRFTVAFLGEGKDIEQRLRERQHKRPLPIPYDKQDEIDTIYYVLEGLDGKYDISVNTSTFSQEQVYEFVTAHITNFRISHPG